MRLGYIGAGFISTFHATALTMVRDVEITAVLRRSRSPQLVEHCKSMGVGSPIEYDSIAEVVQNCDVVAIYNPNFLRIETMQEIVAAIEAGAALTGVIIEKPLGRTMKEARTLVELAKRARLKTAYFENQIFMKAIAAQREQLTPSMEAMGAPSLVRSAEEHGGPHANWFWDPRKLGGGVLMDMGCHSIAVGQYLLTPSGKPLSFLEPVAVSCDTSLLKWGESPWRETLLEQRGIDYAATPAEDFATGIITYRNPETGALVKSQFTDSWMFEKQGLRLMMDGMGPGYAFEVNTLRSPAEIFIGDAAAESLADAELALEKSTATRGLLPIQANEADLYGYIDENRDMVDNFSRGNDAMLNWEYGLEITRLLMAAYYSAEHGKVIDLTDPQIDKILEEYVPAIQKGEGNSVLRRGAKN